MTDTDPVWIIKEANGKRCCTIDTIDPLTRRNPSGWVARMIAAFDDTFPERGPHRAVMYVPQSTQPARTIDDLFITTITAAPRT